MPWKCRRHKDVVFSEKEQDAAPSCAKCGSKQGFVYWDSGKTELTGVTQLKTGTNFTVYIEAHQGKHVEGAWPQYNVGTKGTKFKSTLVSSGNTDFLLRLWDQVEAAVTASAKSQDYGFIDCGSEKVGTKGETYVILQWCKTGSNYCFHAYPEAAKRNQKIYVELE